MFVQFFRVPVADRIALRSIILEWMRDHAPRATETGWIATTAVVDADGVLTAFGMFDSPEAARLNGDRPGQNDWWSRMATQFTGPVVFRNCTQVEVGRGGATDPGTRFARVIEGRTSDRARLRLVAADFDRAMTGVLPELLGFAIAFHDEDPGAFSQIWCFASEEASRNANLEELAGDPGEWMRAVNALSRDVRTIDMPDPWMDSLR